VMQPLQNAPLCSSSLNLIGTGASRSFLGPAVYTDYIQK
jgi:hypothetical protein